VRNGSALRSRVQHQPYGLWEGYPSLALPMKHVSLLLRIDRERRSGAAVVVDVLEAWRAIYPLKSSNNIFLSAQLIILFLLR